MAPRIEQMLLRIQAGVRSGAINRQVAVSLRADLRSLMQLERQYSRGGSTNPERQELQTRLRALRQDVRRADGGANSRYDDWDRQTDRDDDHDDDRGYATDGRWDHDNRDDDDRQPSQRDGIGGLIDNVPGRKEATLEVGQRAPSSLYGVPYEYRDRYRDTSQSYYRSDGPNRRPEPGGCPYPYDESINARAPASILGWLRRLCPVKHGPLARGQLGCLADTLLDAGMNRQEAERRRAFSRID